LRCERVLALTLFSGGQGDGGSFRAAVRGTTTRGGDDHANSADQPATAGVSRRGGLVSVVDVVDCGLLEEVADDPFAVLPMVRPG